MRKIKELWSRVRFLEWSNVALWGALGGCVFFWIPRLEPVFASFGAELPASTKLLLHARPYFILPFGGALAAYLTIAAIFAPMFTARSPRLRRIFNDS
jgi:type II secretory pathway component PulF